MPNAMQDPPRRQAGKQRALLIGISNTPLNRVGDSTLTDVGRMRDLLVYTYGYHPSDITIVKSSQPPPDESPSTLSSWLKNMNKLNSLINRLQELASSAPPEHRSQLFSKVASLRATSKRQQERFMKFLQLSEEYANHYLLGISAEIQQQSTILDNLEERLEAAKKLHGEAVDLQTFYESGTVAAMKEFRVTVPRPHPQDDALFSEVDLVLAEIRRFYEELNKFWTEEIRHVVEALKKGRTDLRDLERWNDFHSSLKQTIEFWKNRPPSGDAQTIRSNNTYTSIGVHLGAIASSLSPTIGTLEEALDRIHSSRSLEYLRLDLRWSQSSFQRVYVGFAANSDMCLSFLRHCADYGEKVLLWYPSFASPATPRVDAAHDLRERTTGLRSEATGVSAENAAAQGSRRFKIVYNRALTIEQKTTAGCNTLLEILSSWTGITDSPSDDALPDIVTLEQLNEVKWAWEKARDSVREALATLTSEPGQRVALMHTGSRFKRWMKSLVFIS